jgi:hypothetical protein
VSLGDVADEVGRLDEVIAGVDVSVVLEGEGVPAGLGEDAQRLRRPHPGCERGVEVGDEDRSDISNDPLVEN